MNTCHDCGYSDPRTFTSKFVPLPSPFSPPPGTCVAVLYLSLHDVLPYIFTSDQEVVQSVSTTMFIVGSFLPFDHFQVGFPLALVRHAKTSTC
jgi:hypothetical protein